MTKVETTSIIQQGSKILLAMKKRGFGKGRWNGVGGKIEGNESILESALREAKEEIGVTMLDPIKMGKIIFHFQDSDEEDHEVHFYKATRFLGTPQETEEMKPKWFNIKKIPYKKMWPDDKYWLPIFLKGKNFEGKFEFDTKGKIAKKELQEIERKKLGVGFGVMILKNRKILLGRRHEDPEKADSELGGEGTWTMPGGKLEFGESFEEGAIREALEETSIKIKNPKVICVNNDKNEKAHFITMGLLVTEFEGTAQALEPEEITEWKWFKSEELPKNIFPPSMHVLENYKQKRFYINDKRKPTMD